MGDLNIDNPQPTPHDVELPGMPETSTDGEAPVEVTMSEIAAAALTSLETLVKMLPEALADEVIEAFETRAALFAGADPS